MKIILVSHGSYSKGLYETIEMILGPQENISYVGLYPENNLDWLVEEIEKELKTVPNGEEILVFTDMFYGSPFNAVVRLMENYNLYHVTGINVPLLMEALTMRNAGKSAQEISDQVVELAGSTATDVRKKLEL